MKKLLAICACLALTAIARQPLAEAVGKRQITIYPKSGAVLEAGGKVQIVLDRNAPRTTQFAAQELALLLGGVLGEKIPVSTEIIPDRTPIYLGACPQNNFLKVDNSLDRDGYRLVIRENSIHIAGHDDPKANAAAAIHPGNREGIWQTFHARGTLFGVYEFLERFAGVRLYFPGELGTILPPQKKITLPQAHITDRPDWPGRHFQGVFSPCAYFEGPDPTSIHHYGRNHQLFRLRSSTQYPISVMHGTTRLNYVNRFSKTHPEYFRQKEDGTRELTQRRNWGCLLCFSSPVFDELYQDYKAMFAGDVSKRPGLEKSLIWGPMKREWIDRKFVDAMAGDAFEKCQCKACLAAYTNDEHYATELIWNFTARMAEKFLDDKDVVVAGCAYYPYQTVPKCNLPSNMEVEVCVTGPYDKHNPKKLARDNQLIAAWHKKLGKKVFLANYGYKRRMEGIPNPTPRAYAEYYKSQMQHIGGIGIFYNETDRFLYTVPQEYVFSRLAWDNKTDTDALLKEFYANMFGPAAPVMTKVMERFEDIWLQDIGGRTIETDLGPMSSYPSVTEIWSKIYSKEVLAQLTTAFDQAEKMTTGLHNQRVKLFRQEYLLPLQHERDAWEKKASLPESLVAFLDTPFELIPQPGQTPKGTQKTLVKISVTDNDLVFDIECQENVLDKVSVADRKQDDPEIWKDNSIEIFLNPDGSKKYAYQLIINSKGVFSDNKITYLGQSGSLDWGFNTNAKVTVTTKKNAWLANVRIPLAALPGLKKNGIPMNIARSRVIANADNEYYCWSPFTISAFGDIDFFGKLMLEKSLVDNFSFTKPMRGGLWGDEKPGRLMRDDKVFFTAPASLKVVSERISVVGQRIYGLKPNTKYRLSCVIKTEGITPVGVVGGACLKIQDAPSHQTWVPSPGVGGTNDWHRYSIEFTTAANISNPLLNAWIYNGKGTAWFDDITIVEIK